MFSNVYNTHDLQQERIGYRRYRQSEVTALYEDILRGYKNVVKLKKGGQKTVYTAEDRKHGKIVVKIGTATSSRGISRAKLEASLLRKISSPYYPQNFDFKILSGGRFLIIEEYIDGTPLTLHFRDFRDQNQAIALLNHLVQGLTVLWNLGIAHCDIKPSNILILADKAPKIIDLGIAKILKNPPYELTRKSKEHCTPSYASPEQLQNQTALVDYRTDQFSLGIVFAQLLLHGHHPFSPLLTGGNSIRSNILADNWCREAVTACCHPDIAPIITRILAYTPLHRYPDPNELAADVRAAVEKSRKGSISPQ